MSEITRSGSLPSGFVLRAKIVLLLADGLGYAAIKEKLATTAPTIWRWKKRFLEEDLKAHPNIALHFTPTYSSWLIQIELWFSKAQRDVIARGVFTSTADLARRLCRYINAYSKHAKPIL